MAGPLHFSLAFFLFGASCSGGNSDQAKASDPPSEAIVRLGAVSLVVSPDVPSPITDQQLTEKFTRSLGRLGPLPPDFRPAELLVKASVEIAEQKALVVLHGRLKGPSLPVEVSTAVAATGPAETERATKLLIENTADELVTAFAEMGRLLDADENRLVRALGSAEPDMQILATRLLAWKKTKASTVTEALARLLGDPREPVADAAAEALGQIGEQKAVPLLISNIKPNDLRSETRALEAMAAIGGPQARAYLEMTAMGHEVPEIRRLSEFLLKQISPK